MRYFSISCISSLTLMWSVA